MWLAGCNLVSFKLSLVRFLFYTFMGFFCDVDQEDACYTIEQNRTSQRAINTGVQQVDGFCGTALNQ